ncbi:MAG: type II toxin-antitoxin system VapC family toxin [Hormoscilla sp. GM7CHS1pb]|nr:type II toxin-antitoxin system VapC family toxin [Hormoscilla sp. GM7CHS1pb]
MKLLLDTHIFLWFITNDNRLADKYYDAISNLDNEIYLSVVSVWEAMIKYQLGKLPLPESPDIYFPKQRENHLIYSLAIDESTITQLAKLPAASSACSCPEGLGTLQTPPLHRDPFDRLLLCQCLQHDLIMITEDRAILSYPMINFF